LCGSGALRLEEGREFDLHMGIYLSLEKGQKEEANEEGQGAFYSVVASYFTNHIHNTAVFSSRHISKFPQNIFYEIFFWRSCIAYVTILVFP
jgi:hypothetical protein